VSLESRSRWRTCLSLALAGVIAVWTSPPIAGGRAGTTVRKILYFEGLPRPEMKFIRRATYDAPKDLRLVVLQRTADGKYIRFVDTPDELQDGFPSSRDELFKYHGLILGSADARLFTAEQHRMIADFVTVRGGGLLALGGEQSFGEGGWLETPVSYLLPIAFDPNRSRRSPRVSLKVRARPTDQGIDHPALKIADDKAAAAKLWKQLPPITIVNAVYVRPDADVLLAGDDATGREQVVLAVETQGTGRVAAFVPHDSWMWVMNAKVDSPAHERFWRNLLEWLVDGEPAR
jgi:uncharacterized membrane protein